MNLLFWIVYITWFSSEIILNRILRSRSTDKQNEDKHSLRIIWITISIACFSAGFVAGATAYHIYSQAVFQYLFLGFIMLGVVLRLMAVLNLGKFFTVDVTIRQGHQLKQDGMYRYIRHPSYAASLLSFVGYGLTLNNWISLLIILVSIPTVFILRINIEEKVLAAQFGDEYIEYKRRTKRLVPFVY